MEYNDQTKDLIRTVGRIAYNGGLALSYNPYESPDLRALWIEGWREAEAAILNQADARIEQATPGYGDE